MADNKKYVVDKILSCDVIDKTGKVVANWQTTACPLFEFCNCKTAMCRVTLPDESCHWYRYFEKLIMEKKNETNTYV